MEPHVNVGTAAELGGTLGGHVLPGALLIAWAAVWMAEGVRGGERRGATLERGPAMPLVKLLLPLVGVWVEIPGQGWYPMDVMMNWQHVTMYAAFSLAGAVDLLALRGALSPGATYVAYAAAHLNAGFLFLGHLAHGGLPAVAHALLAVLFAAAAGAALLELARPGAGTAWARRGALLTVGTWFLVVGWMLYRSGWDLADPVREGWAYLTFSWTVLGVAVVTVGARLLAGRSAPERPSV